MQRKLAVIIKEHMCWACLWVPEDMANKFSNTPHSLGIVHSLTSMNHSARRNNQLLTMSIVAGELRTKSLLLSQFHVILLLSNRLCSIIIIISIIIISDLDICKMPMDSPWMLEAFMQMEVRLAPQSVQCFRLLVCGDVASEATWYHRSCTAFDCTLLKACRVDVTKAVLRSMKMDPAVGDRAAQTAHNDAIHHNNRD